MKRNPMQPVFPPVPLYKHIIGLLMALIAIAVGLAELAAIGTAVLRLLEIHSIADRLLPTWSWWKLAAVAAVGGFIASHLCGWAYKWVNGFRG
jgi:hypothetical protein